MCWLQRTIQVLNTWQWSLILKMKDTLKLENRILILKIVDHHCTNQFYKMKKQVRSCSFPPNSYTSFSFRSQASYIWLPIKNKKKRTVLYFLRDKFVKNFLLYLHLFVFFVSIINFLIYEEDTIQLMYHVSMYLEYEIQLFVKMSDNLFLLYKLKLLLLVHRQLPKSSQEEVFEAPKRILKKQTDAW